MTKEALMSVLLSEDERSGSVFFRMPSAAATRDAACIFLLRIISASVLMASGVSFSQRATTSGVSFGLPPGLPDCPLTNGIVFLLFSVVP